MTPHRSLLALVALFALALIAPAQEPNLDLPRLPDAQPRNIVFILVDDHRYDALGFMDHPFLKTPNLDALASGGVHFRNAFVTTSLCSPSRASILTGQYVHNHSVVDNNNRAAPGTIFFPQYLQQAGYQTAFVGKWHMGGESDEPRPGFDHWISFRGQGRYNPPANGNWSLNVNGRRVPQRGYITDELTDYAIEWLDGRQQDKPFFLYLSHKAVHAEFEPAERHADLYSDVTVEPPETQANTEENYRGKPMWVKNQRNSWHGVDFPYHSTLDVAEYYRQYCRTLAGVDDSVGRVMKWLEDNGLDENTLVVYMGDNGFLFGEHGLIDKRNAYEESIRVPMLAHCPELFEPGTVVEGIVANIDIAPAFLAAAGLAMPDHMDGRDFLPLATGQTEPADWRKQLVYEYYWEWNFPHTPTVFALRRDRYKLVVYHGIWDTDELYDIQTDRKETTNLIREPEHQQLVQQMRRDLYNELAASGGTQIPFGMKRGDGANLRGASGSEAADFPEHVIRGEE
ncbi:MAG: sulfatase [Pirellulales bacterium]